MTRTKFKLEQIEQITNSNIDKIIADAAILYNKLANFFAAGNVDWTSDTAIASAKAIKALIDASVAGLWDNRGNYDASGNVFPSAGGSGDSGAILKSDVWVISVAGTLGTLVVSPGDVLIALVDAPGQTQANWNVCEFNLGYTPQQALTAAVLGALITSYTAKTTPVDADDLIINDSVTGEARKVSFTALKALLKTYFDGYYGSGAGDMILASTQTITGLKMFEQGTLALKGSSTGKVIITTDHSSSGDYILKVKPESGFAALTSDIHPAIQESLSVSGSVGSQTSTLLYTPYDPTKTLMISINGQLQTQGIDYTISSKTITWLAYNTDSIDLSSETIIAIYQVTQS